MTPILLSRSLVSTGYYFVQTTIEYSASVLVVYHSLAPHRRFSMLTRRQREFIVALQPCCELLLEAKYLTFVLTV
jgi:hypothetical protein